MGITKRNNFNNIKISIKETTTKKFFDNFFFSWWQKRKRELFFGVCERVSAWVRVRVGGVCECECVSAWVVLWVWGFRRSANAPFFCFAQIYFYNLNNIFFFNLSYCLWKISKIDIWIMNILWIIPNPKWNNWRRRRRR